MGCAALGGGLCLALLEEGPTASRPETPLTSVRVWIAGVATGARCGSPFCTIVHSFPQPKFQIRLAKKNGRVYSLGQIEPGSLKNLAAQLKEGAAAARQLRPPFF